MIFLYFYILLLPLAVGSIFLKKIDQKKMSIFFIFAYLVVFALAFRFGVDWYEYEKSFYNPGENYFEYGYFLLEKTFNYIGFDYYYFQFLIKLLFWIACFRLICFYSPYPAPTVFLFFILSSVFLNDFVRQQAAAIFIIIAFLRINKGFLDFFLLVVFSSLFHKSAIFVLPFYFLYKSIKLENSFILLVFLSFFLSLINFSLVKFLLLMTGNFFGSEIGERILFYYEITSSDLTAGRLIRFIIFSFVVITYKIGANFDFSKKNRVVYIAFLMMLGYEMIFYDVVALWARVREYFMVFFPILFFIIFDGKLNKLLAYAALIFYAAYSFYGINSNDSLFDNYSYYNNTIYCSIVGCEKNSIDREVMVDYYWSQWVNAKR